MQGQAALNALRVVQIVDDDESIRHSLSLLVRSLGYQAQSWVDGDAFLTAAPSLGPSCILLDLSMPGRDGLAVQADLQKRCCSWPIIFLSGSADVPRAVEAVRRGALDFLVKPAPKEDLERVLKAGFCELEKPSKECEADEARRKLSKLTPRENDVLEGLVEGLPNKSIAYDLGVSPRTIEAHRASIMKKLEANNFALVVKTVCEARL